MQVAGRFAVHERFGPQLTVESVRAAEAHEYDRDELVDGPAARAAQMEADLRELLATIQNPHLRRLLDAVLGEGSPTWARFRDAPAAKHYHQAYRHGLLEHSLTVAQAVSAISATFPGIDRDVAVTGALLHDIGKLEAYETHGERDRDVRPRPAVRRDPARLLPRAPRDRATSTASRQDSRRRCCTSSSATTARSSTAARWCPARARRRSCT